MRDRKWTAPLHMYSLYLHFIVNKLTLNFPWLHHLTPSLIYRSGTPRAPLLLSAGQLGPPRADCHAHPGHVHSFGWIACTQHSVGYVGPQNLLRPTGTLGQQKHPCPGTENRLFFVTFEDYFLIYL